MAAFLLPLALAAGALLPVQVGVNSRLRVFVGGAATTIGPILTGQIMASIVIDHFGLIRVAVHEATVPRVLSALLIMPGGIVVQRF